MWKNEVTGCNDMAVWKDFRLRLMWQSQSDAKNQNRHVHGSVTMYTDGSIPFILHAKWMVGFFLLHPFLLVFFINIFNWQHLYAAGYGSWMQVKPDGAFCWNVYWFSNTFFLCYYFLEFDIYFFLFRIYITVGWRIETRMILRSIRICDWR
jgi:hypothetical protein